MATSLADCVSSLTVGTPTVVRWRGLDFQATVRRSKRARRAKLRILDGQLEVVLPLAAPSRVAFELLSLHEEWAFRFLQKSAKPRPSTLTFRGEPLKVVTSDEVRHAMYRPGLLTVPPGDVDQTVRDWMKNQALCIFRDAIELRSNEMGLWPKRVQFRDQRSKWGACSSTGTVTFNWRVVMAPPEVLDYLVVHELAHLKELNHSSRFWAIVERHCSDHKRLRRWLKQNGYALQWPDKVPL